MLLFQTLSLISQNRQDYYVVVKPSYSLEPSQRTINQDQTLTLDLIDNNLESFLNNKSVFYIDKAFPTATTPYLKRVYKITLDNNTHINDFFNRNEIEYVELTNEGIPLYTPNDFEGLDGNPMSQLDLINAQQAWDVTQGDPNVIVGIVDTYFETTHDDLTNQILQNIDDNVNVHHHGTKVAGFVAAQTNNNIGVSSIGFNTKLITQANGLNTNQMLLISQIPGVRIINGSWYDSCSYSPVNAAVYEEIWNNGVIPIFAAGNGGTCGNPNAYVYPAAYDHTIAISSVGHVYPVGTDHPTLGMRDWKDVHEKFIGDPNSTHQHNDKVDLVAPGYHMTSTSNGNNYFDNGNGTSYASPTVAGVAALMLAANPNLTPDEVRNILRNTADNIYQIPENAPYINLLGTGRVNAYNAVFMAQCLANPSNELDLYVKDSIDDDGTEPNTVTQNMWTSQDIWIRNNDDNGLTHQNPEYRSNDDPNYINVRVINKSCVSSMGNETLTINWGKANTALAWPQNWDGSLQNNQGFNLGGALSSIQIPIIPAGGEVIMKIPWVVPNPDNYSDNDNPWHFCLLARIDSTADPMGTFTSNPNVMVRNNNNLAWKNITVVDLVEDRSFAMVMIANPSNISRTFFLELQRPTNEGGKPIFEEAEVTLKMDEILYEAWERGGKQAQLIEDKEEEKSKLVKGENVFINNIMFNANEMGLLTLDFNFLTKELTDKEEFTYHIIQKDANTGEVMGGETFVIKKNSRQIFIADAGEDKEINENEIITISAEQINEAAIYNWYDSDGNLIYQGKDLTVSADVTKKYKLEIISEIDGYKDYAEVEVKLKPSIIESISPNPALNQVQVNYKLNGINSAYLMVTSQYGTNGISNNYVLNTESNQNIINISNYTDGYYTVALVCNGQIVDTKTLIKQ